MNGLGNDFVILDRRNAVFEMRLELAKAIASRHSGIGCDQIIILEPSRKADIFMRIINADGSEVDACGNATRCVGRLIMNELESNTVCIETGAGILQAFDGGSWSAVSVDMGRPLFGWNDIPLAMAVSDTRKVQLNTLSLKADLPAHFSAASMGNPHAVFFVNNVEAHDLARIGPILENHPMFPERANISLVCIKSPTHLVQKVWERGAGLTIACGTGACAAAVCAMRAEFTERKVTVTLPGGDLEIEWLADGHVMMGGKVEFDFTGNLNEAIFSGIAEPLKVAL